MPLAKIIAKAVVGSTKGKVAGRAAAAAAEKKALAAKAAKAAKAAAAKAAKANARGLKAAQGPSLAPKGYGPDYARRQAQQYLDATIKTWGPSNARMLAGTAEAMKVAKGPGPVNVISKSGRVANTVRLKKTAAKTAAKKTK